MKNNKNAGNCSKFCFSSQYAGERRDLCRHFEDMRVQLSTAYINLFAQRQDFTALAGGWGGGVQ
jgi:hypothetical protein